MKTLLIAVLFSPLFALAQQATVLGKWKTIDDNTKQEKSIVEISPDGKGGLKGVIVELIKPDDPNPLCTECTDHRKNQPVIGMQFMEGFVSSEDGQEWTGGKILDPKNGKVYKCKMKLTDGGRKLDVRGYIGFSLIGRTQTWIRATP